MEDTFGALINKEKDARGLSFDRLSDETEKYGHRLSPSYIFRLVKGERTEPTIKTIKVLMEALNLDVIDVLRSLGMGEFLKELYYEGFTQPIDITDLLLQANVIIRTDTNEIKVSKKQKGLISSLVSDLYKVALQGGFEDFNHRVMGYAENLRSVINNEKYVIELEDDETCLELNIEKMIETYGIKKADILDDLKDVDVKALYNYDSSIPMFLMGEDWLCEREENTIYVKDKVSEIRKTFRKK